VTGVQTLLFRSRPPLSLIISSANPVGPSHPPPSLSPLRTGAIFIHLRCSRCGSVGARGTGGEEAVGPPPPPSTIGCSSLAGPGGHRAGQPWFGEPGGILALRAKEPVFSVVRGLSSPSLSLYTSGSSRDCGRVSMLMLQGRKGGSFWLPACTV
jgi:hypothetical protein